MFPKRLAIHRQLDKFLATIDHIIELKRQKIRDGDLSNDVLEESERDLLTLMIESESRGEGGMSDEELKSNICVFFFAGHDTTSSALSYALYYLATHPVSIASTVYLHRLFTFLNRIFNKEPEKRPFPY
jgi:cytochrome P450